MFRPEEPPKQTQAWWSLALLVTGGVLLSGTVYFYNQAERQPNRVVPLSSSNFSDSQIVAPPIMPSSAQPAPIQKLGPPTRLTIPRIGVDAVVVSVGLTAQEVLKVPVNIAEAGWYQLGPFPGDEGDAIITGHVVGPRGQPGVFAKLEQLQQGDTLSVQDNAGINASFVVREIHTYDAAAAEPSIFFTSDNKAHLNIITCTDWDAKRQLYARRLVIFTDVAR